MKEAIEKIVRSLVGEPDAVEVYENADGKTVRIEVRVADNDMGRVIGREGRTVRRIVSSFESWARRFGPTQPLATGVPPEYLGDEESLRLRRFIVEGQLWRPSYIERVRVNGFGLVEDFDVGQSASLGIGLAPRLLGSSEDEAYTRGQLTAGNATSAGCGGSDRGTGTHERIENRAFGERKRGAYNLPQKILGLQRWMRSDLTFAKTSRR